MLSHFRIGHTHEQWIAAYQRLPDRRSSGAMHTRMVFTASGADKSWRIRSTLPESVLNPCQETIMRVMQCLDCPRNLLAAKQSGSFFISMSRSFTAVFQESGRTFGRVQSTSQQFSSAQYFFRAFPNPQAGAYLQAKIRAVSREG